MHLIADIGGTNARFALVSVDGTVHEARCYSCNDFAGPVETARAYLSAKKIRQPPENGAFCVACPVLGDQVKLTNSAWNFSIERTRREIGLKKLTVLNDCTAQALSVPQLGDDNKIPLTPGEALPDAPIAVVGPGTGLGVSGLLRDSLGGWVALSGEGGHVTFAPRTEREMKINALLAARYGHVSVERIASGPGLRNVYNGLRELDGLAQANVTGPEIAAAATGGSDPVAIEALDIFAAVLADVASDLVLTLGAKGGVYIGGGIVPKVAVFFKSSSFRARFKEKGRFSDYLREVPSWIITHEFPAFLGLAQTVIGPK